MFTQEYFHIYNRGAHKAPIFQDGDDYWRMLKLLFIANNDQPFEIRKIEHMEVFSLKRESPLVDIIAYCLMPNHVHILIRKRAEASPPQAIVTFIHKLMTAYTGYFNRKYDHSGTIWQGPYNHKFVHDISYLSTVIDYIHLNPYGIITPEMTKEARSEHRKEALTYSANYQFSSFQDYMGISRVQSTILTRGGLA